MKDDQSTNEMGSGGEPVIPEPFRSAIQLARWAEVADAEASSPLAKYGRGWVRTQLGREAEARTDYESAALELGDYCRIELAYLDIRQRSDVQMALRAARKVIRSSPAESRLRARACHVAGLAEGKLRHNAAGIDLLLKAARHYRQLEDAVSAAQVLDTLGSMEAARGRLDLALNFYSLSLVDKSLLGDRAGMALTLGNIGRIHLRLGRYDDALLCFERDLGLSIELGDARGEARMREDIGRTHLAAGSLNEADAALARCIDLAGRGGFVDLSFFAQKDLALLRLAQGRLDDASEALAAADLLLPEGAEPYLKHVLAAARGELAIALDRPEARHLLEEAVSVFLRADLPDLEIPTRVLLARALARQRLRASAEDCLLKGLRRARADGYARYLPLLKQEMARLDLVEGIIEEKNRSIARESRSAEAGKTNESSDGYLILGQLGSGAFGEVFRAYDSLRARDVALKRFRLSSLYDVRRRKTMISSAKLELEAASRVRHPGVVRISAVGFDENGELYLVSDFVEGTSLRDIANRLMKKPEPGPADISEILRYLELIADALEALHDAGVVHRDLKPENVIVTADRLPVLVDFGIAHVTGGAGGMLNIAGTPTYMAPEQAKGATVDRKADIYALGVLAYEWLSGGHLPVAPLAKDVKSIATDLATMKPAPLTKYRPGLDKELSSLIMSMLAKNPEDRPQRASKVAEQFKQISRRIWTPPTEPADDASTHKNATTQADE